VHQRTVCIIYRNAYCLPASREESPPNAAQAGGLFSRSGRDCKHIDEKLSSWLRQRIEHVYQAKGRCQGSALSTLDVRQANSALGALTICARFGSTVLIVKPSIKKIFRSASCLHAHGR
jgi:hypothetical protein